MAADFYIKQGATQPVLVMKVNRNNLFSYEKFNKALENCAITFSMVDIDTNILKIAKKQGGLITYNPYDALENALPQYYIYYKFTNKDTNKPGKYRAEFKINFFGSPDSDMEGVFITPIHEDLYINITKSLFTDVNKNGKSNDDSGGIFTDEFNSTFN